jgi:hypothetical protein
MVLATAIKIANAPRNGRYGPAGRPMTSETVSLRKSTSISSAAGQRRRATAASATTSAIMIHVEMIVSRTGMPKTLNTTWGKKPSMSQLPNR